MMTRKAVISTGWALMPRDAHLSGRLPISKCDEDAYFFLVDAIIRCEPAAYPYQQFRS